jgi:hypothetical protein
MIRMQQLGKEPEGRKGSLAEGRSKGLQGEPGKEARGGPQESCHCKKERELRPMDIFEQV